MAKLKTLEFHTTDLQVIRLAEGRYAHNITMTDYDDGEQIKIEMLLTQPASVIMPIKIRVTPEDLPESTGDGGG